MVKKAFTMMEVLIAFACLAVFATIGFPVYQNSIESSKAKICETNLKALSDAMDIYAMEHDKMPASLSALPDEYINKAYAKMFERKDGWQIKLAYFLVEMDERSVAYAAFLLDDIAKGQLKIISCPKDSTPPSSGGVSYGLNSKIANMSSQDFRNLDDSEILLGDCENATFTSESELDPRHERYKIFSSDSFAQSLGRTDDKTGHRHHKIHHYFKHK